MSNPKILDARTPNAGFSVKFVNGFVGEPDIEGVDLVIDADGMNNEKAFLMAAVNWLVEYAEKHY